MRKITFLIASLMYITSCSTGKYTASSEYDDVYYSKRDKVSQSNVTSSVPVQQNNTQPEAYSSPQNSQKSESIGNDDSGNQRFDYNIQNNTGNQQQPDYTSQQQQDGNTYITNNYYSDDDYYDYAYSSRLRRFYHPCGWGYYDTYYTNSYLYDYDPFSWGVSIYLGYNWWNPYHSLGPYWGVSFGYGYPNYGFAYDPWYSPYYSPYYNGFGYGSGYYQGYQNGYMNGYYNGLYNGTFNPYYFNSFDSYSYYYGPHGRGNSLNATGGTKNISQLYATTRNDETVTPHVNQSSNNLQPFVKIKHNTSLSNENANTHSVGGDIKDTKGGNSQGGNTGGIKVMPDVKVNNNVPVKEGHDTKGEMDNSNPSPIKVPSDIKSHQNNNNIDAAPVNDPANIKVIHNNPIKNNPDIRNDDYNNNTPVKDPGNIKHNPSNGIIRNPNNEAPIRNNSNDHSPSVKPDQNQNIRNQNNDQPIRQNNNTNESTPIRSPKTNGGARPELNPGEQPVKNQPQYNSNQNERKEQNRKQRPGFFERIRENISEQDSRKTERKSSTSRDENNSNSQNAPFVSPSRQSEQRGSNSNDNNREVRGRH